MKQDTRAPRLRRARFSVAAAAAIAAGGFIAMSAAPNGAMAQGFCNEVGPAAPIVCQSRYLTGLANEARAALRQLVRSTPREQRPALLREQRDWSFSLRQCLNGPSEECLSRAYQDRIASIGQRLNGQIGAPLTASREPVEQQPLQGFESERSPQFGADDPEGQQDDEAFRSREQAALQDEELDEDPVDRDIGADDDAGDDEIGAERGTARTAARPADDEDGEGPGSDSDAATLLPAKVWKAQIASGIRPGTIFVFQRDGALVTADCVESYRLGTWDINSDGMLELNDSSGPPREAKIVGLRDRYVRLQLADAGDGRAGTLVLRPAVAPFSCKGE